MFIQIVFSGILFALLLILSITDIRTHTLPNAWVALLAFFGVVWAILNVEHDLTLALVLIAVIFTLGLLLSYGAERFLGRPALGMGDVKLYAVLALWLPAARLPLALVFASLFALAWILFSRSKRQSAIAFGPFLSLSATLFWIDATWVGD